MKEIKHVHVDGMDLAGKSTTLRNYISLSDRDWIIKKNTLTSNPIYNLLKKLWDESNGEYDSEIIDNLFTAAIQFDLNNFKEPTQDTLQEKSMLLKSLAHQTMVGNTRLVEYYMKKLSSHPKFTDSFIITADHEDRLNRLKNRVNNKPEELDANDYWIVDRPDFFYGMENVLINISVQMFNSIVINTSVLSQEEVTLVISNKIQ